MRTTLVKATLITAGLLVASLPASAQGYAELGGFGTYAKFDPTLGLKGQNSGGARMSLASGEGLSTFILEGEATYFSFDLGGGFTQRMVPGRARLMYAPQFGRVSVLVGGGGMRNQYLKSPAMSQAFHEWGYTGDAGLRLAMGNYMALRVDGVLDYITHPLNGALPGTTVKRNTNRYVQAGLSFPFWSMHSPPKPASEPRQVIVAERKEERKADEPKLADSDNDGVPDIRDQCGGTPAGATVDAGGCQVYRDSDNDGVIDLKDNCPGTYPGTQVDGRGCPLAADSDNDGVPDTRDRCPNTPAGVAVNSVGCEAPVPEADADHDNVPDSRDKCPNSPIGQPVDATGCAPAVVTPQPVNPQPLFKGTNRTVTLRGVTFEPWKDELTQSSIAVLDDVAHQLNDAPEVRVEIGGHTDNGGAYTRNLRLSLQRAEAVRAYLIMKGVDAGRLVARGYGPNSPVASNATAGGRAMNRRVELKRID